MWSKNCGRAKSLCPVSFGLALGITSAIAALLWSIWLMYHGMPTTIEHHFGAHPTTLLTWGDSFLLALIFLIKGFVFGVVLALLYDLIACCCKARCCRGADGECNCDCCDPGTKRVRTRK